MTSCFLGLLKNLNYLTLINGLKMIAFSDLQRRAEWNCNLKLDYGHRSQFGIAK